MDIFSKGKKRCYAYFGGLSVGQWLCINKFCKKSEDFGI